MSTPSERIFAYLADDDGVELRDFLPAQARHPMTLARTADRIAAGTTLQEAVADFVDDLRWARDADDIARRITERPRDLDPRTDAYLAALAEHFAAAHAAPPHPGPANPAVFWHKSGGRTTPAYGHAPSWSPLRHSVGEASCSVQAC